MKARFKTKKLDDNTFIIAQNMVSNGCTCYLLVGSEKALLIDSGVGFGGIHDAVRAFTDKPVEVVNTHAHFDHIGNNYLFDTVSIPEKDSEVYKLHINPEYLSRTLNSLLPVFVRMPFRKSISQLCNNILEPETISFIKEGHVFDLGGRYVEVIETPGHSPGSVCLLERETKRLFTGDTVSAGTVMLHIAYGCQPAVFLESMKKLEARSGEFNEIWPSHFKRPLDKNYVSKYLACAEGIVSGTLPRKALKGCNRPCHVSSYRHVKITFSEGIESL